MGASTTNAVTPRWQVECGALVRAWKSDAGADSARPVRRLRGIEDTRGLRGEHGLARWVQVDCIPLTLVW